MSIKMNTDKEIERGRYADVKDASIRALLTNRIETLNAYGVQVRIHENDAGNYDLTLASKISTKARGRENLTSDKLREYLNVIFDAFKMANE